MNVKRSGNRHSGYSDMFSDSDDDVFGDSAICGRGRGRGGRGGMRSADPQPDEVTSRPGTYEPTETTNNTPRINFKKLDNMTVRVTGDNAPPPIDSFESINMWNILLNNMNRSGYFRPSPIQKYAIPIVMEGRDLMGCAPKGSGKTAALLVPIISNLLRRHPEVIMRGSTALPQVIILSPTRESTFRIFNEAVKFVYGSFVKVAVAYGGASLRHHNIKKGCNILVATPPRLVDYVKSKRVSFERVRIVVLSEVDRMQDLGYIERVSMIMHHPTMPPKDVRQTLMFAAKFPKVIQDVATNFLDDYVLVTVGYVAGATDVEQVFIETTRVEKPNAIIEIAKENEGKRILVFVEMNRCADFIAAMLSEHGPLTSSIHGDRGQREREQALDCFKSGQHEILVVTDRDVAARGLDINNVDIVVNYDLPKSINEYIHRIGRTRSEWNRGKAISFFDPEADKSLASSLTKILEDSGQNVPTFIQEVAAIDFKCLLKEFLREYLRGCR